MISKKLHGKYSNYRYCSVKECKNTSIKTPGKLWIRVPAETNLRKTWLKLAKRDPHTLSTESPMYFCQDHFDLENDMVNYMEYKIMGTVKRIRMKPDCIPLRFEFQDDGKPEKRKLPPTSNELYASKKIAKMHVFSPIQHNQAQAMVGHADTNLGHEAKMLPKEEQNYVNPQLSEEVLEEEHSLSEFKYQQEDFFVEPSILQQPNDEQLSFEMRREIAIADIADFARTLDEENFNKFAAEMQTLKISFLEQQNSERMHKEIKIEPEET